MLIRDIMTDQVVYVSPETTVEQVAQLMQKHNVGVIPVCDQSGVKGVVTDRDIVVRNVAHGTNPKTIKASDVMTSQVATVNPSTDIKEASQIMAQNQIRRLPVVENNRLVGMVALGDLAENPGFDDESSGALSQISTPSHPYRV